MIWRDVIEALYTYNGYFSLFNPPSMFAKRLSTERRTIAIVWEQEASPPGASNARSAR
jgi:hypothetical protein